MKSEPRVTAAIAFQLAVIAIASRERVKGVSLMLLLIVPTAPVYVMRGVTLLLF
jgi:hypothetical protein